MDLSRQGAGFLRRVREVQPVAFRQGEASDFHAAGRQQEVDLQERVDDQHASANALAVMFDLDLDIGKTQDSGLSWP